MLTSHLVERGHVQAFSHLQWTRTLSSPWYRLLRSIGRRGATKVEECGDGT